MFLECFLMMDMCFHLKTVIFDVRFLYREDTKRRGLRPIFGKVSMPKQANWWRKKSHDDQIRLTRIKQTILAPLALWGSAEGASHFVSALGCRVCCCFVPLSGSLWAKVQSHIRTWNYSGPIWHPNPLWNNCKKVHPHVFGKMAHQVAIQIFKFCATKHQKSIDNDWNNQNPSPIFCKILPLDTLPTGIP